MLPWKKELIQTELYLIEFVLDCCLYFVLCKASGSLSHMTGLKHVFSKY